MAIKASDFNVDLWNTDLPPVAALLGDEAFFITRIGDALRKTGKDQGFTERLVLDQEEPSLANRLLSELDALSLFADRTLVELRLSKTTLDKSIRSALDQWIQNPPDDKRLLPEETPLHMVHAQVVW